MANDPGQFGTTPVCFVITVTCLTAFALQSTSNNPNSRYMHGMCIDASNNLWLTSGDTSGASSQITHCMLPSLLALFFVCECVCARAADTWTPNAYLICSAGNYKASPLENACTPVRLLRVSCYVSFVVHFRVCSLVQCPAGTYGSSTGLATASCSGLCAAGYYGQLFCVRVESDLQHA